MQMARQNKLAGASELSMLKKDNFQIKRDNERYYMVPMISQTPQKQLGIHEMLMADQNIRIKTVEQEELGL